VDSCPEPLDKMRAECIKIPQRGFEKKEGRSVRRTQLKGGWKVYDLRPAGRMGMREKDRIERQKKSDTPLYKKAKRETCSVGGKDILKADAMIKIWGKHAGGRSSRSQLGEGQ